LITLGKVNLQPSYLLFKDQSFVHSLKRSRGDAVAKVEISQLIRFPRFPYITEMINHVLRNSSRNFTILKMYFNSDCFRDFEEKLQL